VLVTSRASLTGLLVAEAASQLTLDLFSREEAGVLLRRILGSARVEAEPEAVAGLVEVCARLPLALRIAATRIATRRHTSVAEVVADIGAEETGLDVLSSSGDGGSAVRTVFDWSYTGLAGEHARLFRRLGLHPGAVFGVPAAAAVAGVDVATAYRQLDALEEGHLVESAGGRRYRLHDLLHAYAAHRAELDDDPEERHAARDRLFTWYARTARAADRLVFPGLEAPAVELRPVGPELPPADRSAALAWLTTEQANLTAVLRAAVEHHAHEAALVLAGTARFLSLREQASWAVRFEAESLGLAAARAAGNRAAEALLLGFRGDTLADLGRRDAAEADFRRQLELADELGDPARQQVAFSGLGQIRFLQERYGEAREFYRRALPRAGGGRPAAVIECNLSRISVRLGEFEQARAHAERELALRREAADHVGEAYALCDVAVALQGLDDHDAAIEYADQAVTLYRTLAGTETLLAQALETAATSFEHTGNLPRAADSLAEAAALLENLDADRAEALHRRARDLEPG
jgi:tetratricopeptide (TPR) repeat protein